MVEPPPDGSALDLYRRLVRERLAHVSCPGCGGELQDAHIVRAGGGAALEGYLSDQGQARLLAATEHWVVHCRRCFLEAEVGELARPFPAPRTELIPPPMPWPVAAVEIYRGGIQERLANATCEGCGGSVANADVLEVSGGTTLDDYDLSDESVARLLAATQHLWVRCPRCMKASEPCERT